MPTAMPSSVQGLTGGRGSPAPGSGLTWPLCPEIINYEFDTKDLVCLGLSSVVGVWYLLRKVSSQDLEWGGDGQREHQKGQGRRHSEPVSLPPSPSTGLPTTSLAWPSPLTGWSSCT